MAVSQSEVSNMLTATEAANALGLTTGRIRQLLLSGELTGYKITYNLWLVDRASVAKYSKLPRTVGRPRSYEPEPMPCARKRTARKR